MPGIDSRDLVFIQTVDSALAEAARKAGPWLACRLGCTACCRGPFPITQLDAHRLRRGLAELWARDPDRAARLRRRARAALALTGDHDEPCPALDPSTGACDLYSARPVTCRTFGLPVPCDSGGLAICELCFDGASEDQVAACAVDLDPANLEAALLDELAAESTSVAAALAG